jgi:hypothetical protein
MKVEDCLYLGNYTLLPWAVQFLEAVLAAGNHFLESSSGQLLVRLLPHPHYKNTVPSAGIL